ncbi:DUF3426 domain-containing protein [Undibacterium sp. Di24W]|uniref:DUF3426 domain-containing protein n=1 Tax=Undibacterium sp. Di24W TaxID=3413033 RepID=UPI003BF010AC
MRHETSDTEVKIKAEIDSTVEVNATPVKASADVQETISHTVDKVDLATITTTSSTRIDDPQSKEQIESNVEGQGIDTPISSMSSDRSQASLMEIMNTKVVQENLNNQIEPERHSGIETADLPDASNLSASFETDKINTIEPAANSSINENLSLESNSTSSALSLEFDLGEDDSESDFSENIKQPIANNETDVTVKADTRTGSTTTNNSHQLNTETVSQANLHANSHEKSQADSHIDLAAKAQEKENESAKPQLAPETKKTAKKPGALTASLDFELSKEERESVDEIAYIHKLELETRAAVLDEATDDWSNHEPKSVQDGFIDSLKELKPILDDIGDFAPTQQASLKSNVKHQTLSDLRFSNRKTDSVADLEVNSDRSQDVEKPDITPAFVIQAERAQRYGKWKRFGLGLGVFSFVLIGAAQTIYFLRSDIAAMAPQLKPQLLSICKTLSCQIKLPAQKSLLEITGSELLIVNEELSMNTLSVQIQNKSSTVQAWPHFDLTLKDRRGKDLLQKAFAPTQYLENKELLNKGMAANSESNHKIFFQLNGLKASDYTVEIFYP